MKTVLLLMAVLLAGPAWSKKLVVKPQDHTCKELEQIIEDNGSVYIKWLFGKYEVKAEADCEPGYEATKTVVRTKDKLACSPGYKCSLKKEEGEE